MPENPRVWGFLLHVATSLTTIEYYSLTEKDPAERSRFETTTVGGIGPDWRSSMGKKVTTRTGQKAPASGQYQPAGTKQEITLSRGDRVPPYSGRAKTFILVDRTKHKR